MFQRNPARSEAVAVAANPTLVTTYSVARELLLVAAGVATLAGCAQIVIPFFPAPFTLQTFAVVLIAACYGMRRGTVTVASYLAAGAIGMPVFAGLGFGPATFFGLTGGYLIGFVGAAAVTGALVQAGFDRGPLRLAFAMTAGTAVIFYGGVSWLVAGWGWQLETALSAQLPYVPGAAAKILLAMAVLPFARRALR